MIQKACIIGGSDSSSGAGIQTDLLSFHHLNVRASSIITAITAQTLEAIEHISWVSETTFKAQLQTLSNNIAAIKIGMLGKRYLVDLLADYLQDYRGFVVLDPLLRASSGRDLYDESTEDYLASLKTLFPLVSLLTPNIPEAEQLLSRRLITPFDIEKAAQDFLNFGLQSVYIKGGHFQGDVSQDYWTNGHQSFWLSSPRYADKQCHGTGCVLSSVIAAGIALGYRLEDALVIAKMYVNRGIRLAETEKDAVFFESKHKTSVCHPREGGDPSSRKHHANLEMDPRLRGDDSNAVRLTPGYGRAVFFQHQSGFPEDEIDLPHVHNHSETDLPKPFPPDPIHGLYPIVDSLESLKPLLALPIPYIQLRIKKTLTPEVEAEIKQCVEMAKLFQVKLYINDHWQLAIDCHAYGVHLGQEDLLTADLARLQAANLRLGISTHCYEEVARAHFYKPSYIAYGPIFATSSKIMPFAPQGLPALVRFRKTLVYPLVAIGGINLQNMQSVLDTGVNAIALISAISHAEDPVQAAKDLFQKVQDHVL